MNEYKIETSKIEPITKKIVGNISTVISQKRAVAIKMGRIGIIFPFEKDKMILDNVLPSINHIYTSYFTNFVSILTNISESLKVNIKPVDLRRNLFKNISNKIAKVSEVLYICPKCNKFSNIKFKCSHKKYTLTLYKINNVIVDAWNRDIILSIYMKHLLKSYKWNVLIEKAIKGSGKTFHQIDVFAVKENKVIIGECKRYSLQTRQVSENDIMKFLGRANDIEYKLNQLCNNLKIIKILITTGKVDKSVKTISNRRDILFLENDEIKNKEKRWWSKIEEKFR